jgi:pimeloyl-ACP methyl ester carboxylesterase
MMTDFHKSLACPPNIPLPTLGGKQFWSDVYHFSRWRIQCHVWTGHHRLLDPDNIRRAWGGARHCRNVLDNWRKRLHLTQRSDHLVILLHGIGRSTGTFSKLIVPLEDAGYEIANVSYASTRRTLEEHAETLSQLVADLEGITAVSFVCHSMGGLVLRQLLASKRPWQRDIEIRRIVLIAPPNQGSVIAALLKNVWPYQWIYGVAGQQLIPETVRQIAPLDQEFGIIAGGTGGPHGINPWLKGDNDGTVTVWETDLPGASDHLLVNAFHVNISNAPDVVRAVVRFLDHGHFNERQSHLDTKLNTEKSTHHA